jgi:hypothetical protein
VAACGFVGRADLREDEQPLSIPRSGTFMIFALTKTVWLVGYLWVVETEFNYTCPNCSQECSVVESLTDQNVTCPACSKEFFATPPNQQSPPILEGGKPAFTLPAKLPFFKSGRRKILEQRLEQMLAASGAMFDDAGEAELIKTAVALGLATTEVTKLRADHLKREFDPIKRRMESTFLMTDEDVAAVKELEKRYNAQLTLGGEGDLCRAIYLLEAKGTLPAPIRTDLMLNGDEVAYYSISTTWHQSRVHSRGYSGTSISVPTGIKGVRFRFGGYSPIRTDEVTPLASGVLYVTSERLLFNGDSRNTTITLKKIIDGHVYSDSVKIEKSTGKPDFFSMDAPRARYVLSLVGALK